MNNRVFVCAIALIVGYAVPAAAPTFQFLNKTNFAVEYKLSVVENNGRPRPLQKSDLLPGMATAKIAFADGQKLELMVGAESKYEGFVYGFYPKPGQGVHVEFVMSNKAFKLQPQSSVKNNIGQDDIKFERIERFVD